MAGKWAGMTGHMSLNGRKMSREICGTDQVTPNDIQK
jgi:hypothetical protein